MRADPWALPAGLLVAIIGVFWAPLLARRIESSNFFAWLSFVSVGGFLAITLTPTDATLHWGWHAQPSFEWQLPSAHDLASLNTTSLNVLAGIPLGLTATILAVLHKRRLAPVFAYAIPVFAECVQWVFPWLGRSGFLLSDVLANWCGVTAGAVLGLAISVALDLLRPDRGAGGAPDAPTAPRSGSIG
jgi:hypothetical protein